MTYDVLGRRSAHLNAASALTVALLISGCAAGPVGRTPLDEHLRRSVSALAHDSLAGRATGSAGARGAARYIIATLESLGVEPAGDSGFVQIVPMARHPAGPAMGLLPAVASLDTVPAGRRVVGWNVVGMLRGASRPDEYVVVGAHYDHVGIGPAIGGDSIYNGADDDASGVAAVLEVARALTDGPPPARSVVFFLPTAEEFGLLGARWFVEHPAVPLDRIVADLQFELLGRPDPEVGFGRAWLTGDERSTMGERFRAAGLAVDPDPRPAQGFFARSDNFPFARAGIPAHTFSTFGLHEDYHRPSDDVNGIDFAHLARVVEVAIDAVRVLTDAEARVAWRRF